MSNFVFLVYQTAMMTTILLREPVQDPSLWKLGSLHAGGAVSTASLVYDGKRGQRFQLTPTAELGSVWIAFEPSVYRGTGNEPRKGIVFSMPAHVQEDLELLEALREKPCVQSSLILTVFGILASGCRGNAQHC